MNSEMLIGELENYFVIGVIIACFLVGFIIKNYTKLPNKYIPLLMIVVGVLVSIVFSFNDNTIINYSTVLSGAVSGLASCGVHDLLKKSLGITRIVNSNNDTTPPDNEAKG